MIEIISKTDQYLVILSSKTYVFEDKMIKYSSSVFLWDMSLSESFSSPSQFENRVSLKPALRGVDVDVGRGRGGIATFLYGT